jgi:hypothetical protein
MDVQYPYADGLARQHLLYRLPAVPAPRRLLLAYGDRAHKSIANGWDGPVEVIAGVKLVAYAKHHTAKFDAIALPQVLGTGSVAAAQTLRAAHHLLVPGGAVIGHVDHLAAWRRLASLGGLGRWLRSATGRAVVGTPAHCLLELARAGFERRECYYVHPHIDSPLSLIPCHQGSARYHFVRAVRLAPNLHGRAGYLVRLAVARLGLGGAQQPQLFFWASKPC